MQYRLHQLLGVLHGAYSVVNQRDHHRASTATGQPHRL